MLRLKQGFVRQWQQPGISKVCTQGHDIMSGRRGQRCPGRVAKWKVQEAQMLKSCVGQKGKTWPQLGKHTDTKESWLKAEA